MHIARTPIFIVVCFAIAGNYVAEAQDAGVNTGCPLATVKLEVNMPRLEAERRISTALGETNKYSPHANNLPGGTTKYESQNCALNVTYAAGAPAPMVRAPGGSVEHKPPKDETVVKFELVRKASSSLRTPVDSGA